MKAVILITTLALAVPIEGVAQEVSDEGETYIYATYFYCDTSRQDEADELVKTTTAPIYDAAAEDGTIKGWGWQAHHSGGQWRRVQYHTASTIEALLAAQNTLLERATEAAGADDAFSEICDSHDDYIWKREAGSSLQKPPGPARLSVYEVCSLSGEQRAKEIAKTVFAPVLDKAVEQGKLASWGWNSHVLGGEYRVMHTMTAKDNATLLNTLAEIIESLYDNGDKATTAAAKEYDTICTSHSDYLWEVRHETS